MNRLEKNRITYVWFDYFSSGIVRDIRQILNAGRIFFFIFTTNVSNPRWFFPTLYDITLRIILLLLLCRILYDIVVLYVSRKLKTENLPTAVGSLFIIFYFYWTMLNKIIIKTCYVRAGVLLLLCIGVTLGQSLRRCRVFTFSLRDSGRRLCRGQTRIILSRLKHLNVRDEVL